MSIHTRWFTPILMAGVVLSATIAQSADDAAPQEVALKTGVYKTASQAITQSDVTPRNRPAMSIDKGYVLPKGTRVFKPIHRMRTFNIAKGKASSLNLLICDDNSDTKYTASDTFTHGKGFVFAPLAKNMATPKGLFEVQGVANEKITLLPKEGVINKFSIKYSGNDKTEAHFAFRSDDEATSLVSLGRGAYQPVPVGIYKLLYGLVYSKKSKKIVAGVLSGKMEPVSVEEGKTVKLTMGKMFHLEFDVANKNGKVAIEPSTIKIYGKAGEEYVGFDLRSPVSVALRKGKKEYPMGRFATGWGGGLCGYTGSIPTTKKKKDIDGGEIQVTAIIEGFGEVKGCMPRP